jgi:hypothetical protein
MNHRGGGPCRERAAAWPDCSSSCVKSMRASAGRLFAFELNPPSFAVSRVLNAQSPSYVSAIPCRISRDVPFRGALQGCARSGVTNHRGFQKACTARCTGNITLVHASFSILNFRARAVQKSAMRASCTYVQPRCGLVPASVKNFPLFVRRLFPTGGNGQQFRRHLLPPLAAAVETTAREPACTPGTNGRFSSTHALRERRRLPPAGCSLQGCASGEAHATP